MLEIVIADPVEMLSDIRQAVSNLQNCIGYDMNDKIREQCNKMSRAIESIQLEFKSSDTMTTEPLQTVFLLLHNLLHVCNAHRAVYLCFTKRWSPLKRIALYEPV